MTTQTTSQKNFDNTAVADDLGRLVRVLTAFNWCGLPVLQGPPSHALQQLCSRGQEHANFTI